MSAVGRRRCLFFRGLNLGNRRVTNDDLAAALASCGCADVVVYQASGNAVVADDRDESSLQAAVEAGLERALGYDVATFVREPDEVRAVLAARPWGDAQQAGKLQVGLLRGSPDAGLLEPFRSDADWLAIVDRHVLWWPAGKITESVIDIGGLERALGKWTMRTQGTLDRLAKKFL